MTFECLNPCTVRVEMTIYRSCVGGSVSPAATTMHTGACTGPALVSTWTPVTYTDITPLAPPIYVSCTVPGVISGIEEGVSYSDYDWCSATCNEVEFRWSTCCRTNNLSNVAGPISSTLTIDNNVMSRPGGTCNNSPVFNAPPTIFMTTTQDWAFDLGATDPDGDSLVYAFVPLREIYPANVSYNAGFSPSQYMGPGWNITLDPATGIAQYFRTPGSVLSAAACIEVREFRGGVQIGSIRREFITTAVSGPGLENGSPVIWASLLSPGTLTFTGTGYAGTMGNDPMLIEIPTADPDSNYYQDIEWLGSSSPMPGAYLADGSGTPMTTVSATAPDGTPTARFYWPSPVVGTYQLQFRVFETGMITNALAADTVELTLVVTGSDSVWPGDANDDLIANNLDLLTVALGFGDTGPVRAGASNTWVAQFANLWGVSLPGAGDEAHTDCDGSGTVDYGDTVAISLNYGLTHTKQGAGLSPIVQGGGVPVYCEFLVDSASVGDTVEVGVFVGDNLSPAANVYGMAFSFNYDKSLVDSASVGISYGTSWFADPTVSIHVSRDFYTDEVLEVGFARRDQQTRSGMGQVATITLVLTDNIDGKNSTLEAEILHGFLSNITLIGLDGLPIAIDLRQDSLVVWQLVTGLNPAAADATLTVWPNPTHDRVAVTLPAGSWDLALMDAQGRVISRQAQVVGTLEVPMAELPKGTYFLRANNSTGTLSRAILKL